MKLLITGASGQLGSSLFSKLENSNIECLTPTREQLDVSDCASVKNYFAENTIDLVVHAAAFTNVDLAESSPEKCMRVNSLGTKYISDECRVRNIYLIYLSTDYVFNGEKSSGYLPDDEPDPISVYGSSKQQGEIYVQRHENSLIIRTAWLFGKNGRNFVDSITGLAKKNDNIKVVSDQKGSPTYVEDLAVLIIECLLSKPRGIVHATNSGECTRAEFARQIIAMQGIDCSVAEISSNDFPAVARRPKNSVLDTSCLDKLNISRLPDWKDALKRYLLDGGRLK